MIRQLLMHTAALSILAGCASNNAENFSEPSVVGSDRDEFGCIGSAGYSWCELTNQCERPWELAAQQGFENTQESFQEYCDKFSL
jgi:hypothetical protein